MALGRIAVDQKEGTADGAWGEPVTKPRAIVSQTGSTSVRIEYVKGRRLLRLTGWRGRGAELGPVEVELPAMVEGLDIDPADVGAEAWYLLFAGRDGERRGGIADLVGAYRCPNESKTKFLELQEARVASGGWAELVVPQPNGQLKAVCWFGEKGGPSPAPRAVERAADPAVRRPRRKLFGGWDSVPRREG